MKERFEPLPLELIIPSRTNPRNPADYKDDDLKSLALSIAESGLIQPVRVRPHKEVEGKYELIVGERRYRAHLMKESGHTTIDSIICNYTDRQVIAAQNIENLQRKNVHPLDEARSFKALMDLEPVEGGQAFTVETIAAEIGKDKSYVYKTLVLNNLIEAYHGNFRSGKITRQIAMMLARQTPEQQKKLVEWIDNRLSYDYAIDPEDVEFEIEHEFHLELSGAPFDKTDPTLVEAAGPCTTCAKSTANAPDLFNDLGKKAKCTDSACFRMKKEVTFERNMKMLRGTGESFVIVNDDRPGTKNVLSSTEYKPAKQSDKGAVRAIHTDEKKRGAVQWVKPSRIPMDEEKKGGKKKTTKKKQSSGESFEVRERKRKALREKSFLLLKPVAQGIINAAKNHKITPALQKSITDWAMETLLDGSSMSDFERTVCEDLNGGWKKLLAYLRSFLNDNQIIYLLYHMAKNNFDVEYEGDIDRSTFKLCQSLGFDGKKIVEEERKKLAKAEQPKKDDKKADAKETAATIAHSKTATTAVGVGTKPTTSTDVLYEKRAGSSRWTKVKKTKKK